MNDFIKWLISLFSKAQDFEHEMMASFGAVEEEPSDSDFLVGSLTPNDGTHPAVFMPDYVKYTDMQSKIGCCGAGAGKAMKEVFLNVKGKPEHLSMAFLWKMIKTIDGVPLGSGTTMTAIMKAVQKFGVASEALVPTNCINADPAAFASQQEITPEAKADAMAKRIGAYAFQRNPSFDDIKSAIWKNKGAILLMRVGKEFWTGKDGVSSWQEKDILPLSPDFPIESGHFVYAYAYDENFIYFLNQWSTAWGRNGIGYFGADYASRVIQLGTSVDLFQKFSKNLQQGDRGTEVGALQLALRDRGYFPKDVKINGIFGPVTKSSVIAFQGANGLPADGMVGAATNAKLSELYGG